MYHTSELGMLLQSRPVEVDFCGWRSTTTQLQAAGWQLAAEQDMSRDVVRVVMRHPELRLYVLTEPRSSWMHRDPFYRGPDLFAGGLVARWVSSKMDCITVPDLDWGNFRAIDANPTWVAERKSIEDYNIFAAPMVRTEEIIVEPKDVQECLDLIKRLQAPNLAEIRERTRKQLRPGELIPQASNQMAFHAQIMSLAA